MIEWLRNISRPNLDNSFNILRKKIAKNSYSILLMNPTFGLSIIRMHCAIRPDYTDADPFKTISINPSSIVGVSNYRPRRHYGKVASGDWDKTYTPITELPAYEGLTEYFDNNRIDRYQEIFASNVTAEDGLAWGHNSLQSFDKRITEIENLYQSIKEEGYKSQTQLFEENRETELLNNEPVPTFLNEVTVDIGRDGTLLYCGFGSHRLAISKILDLDRIFAKVGVRHSQWQSVRDTLKNEGLTNHDAEYFDHPDLNDLIE